MLRRVSPLAAALVLVAALVPGSVAEQARAPAEPVNAQRIAPDAVWDGQQYVAADHDGQVYLLRTESLEVYPVDGVDLGEPRDLETQGLQGSLPVLDAAMDKHGDWVLLRGYEPRWIRSGKDKTLPELRWVPSSVELLDGRPVVAVLPFPVGRWASSELERTTPPLVVAYDEDDWSPIVDGELDAPPETEERMRMRHELAAQSFVDSDDTLWLARRYRYKVDRYSASGRELLSIEADGAVVEHEAEEDLEGRRVELEQERARLANPEQAEIRMNTALPVIEALTEGRDGRIYLLVHGEGGGLVLDRLDTVLATLERVPITVTTPGAASMAAGKDGLYIVPYNGAKPRFLIPWETLEQAAWAPLEGVAGLLPIGAEDPG